MFKLLLIFADPAEAARTLSLFPFSLNKENFYTYHTENVLLDVMVLKTWGYRGVVQALSPPPSGYDLWINAGFSGAGNPNIPLLKTYTITSVKELTPTTSVEEELEVTPIPRLPLAQLTSVRSPYRDGFHEYLQLVDMEGFFIAKQASLVACPCSMIKVSSDYTTREGQDFLKNNKVKLSQKLAEAIFPIYSSFIDV